MTPREGAEPRAPPPGSLFPVWWAGNAFWCLTVLPRPCTKPRRWGQPQSERASGTLRSASPFASTVGWHRLRSPPSSGNTQGTCLGRCPLTQAEGSVGAHSKPSREGCSERRSRTGSWGAEPTIGSTRGISHEDWARLRTPAPGRRRGSPLERARASAGRSFLILLLAAQSFLPGSGYDYVAPSFRLGTSSLPPTPHPRSATAAYDSRG